MFDELDYYSQLGWIQYRQENSPTPEPGDEDYEESSYIREPYASLPSFVDDLGENELRTLHQWHIKANLGDDWKAIEYQRKAKSLRAQAKESDALASEYADRVKSGNEVLQILESAIKFKSKTKSTGHERVSRAIFVHVSG